MYRACELKDQTYKKTRTLHLSKKGFRTKKKTLYKKSLRLFFQGKTKGQQLKGKIVS